MSSIWLFWCTKLISDGFFFQSEASDTAKIANLLPKIWSTLTNYINTSSIEFMVVLTLLFPVKFLYTAKHRALKIQL